MNDSPATPQPRQRATISKSRRWRLMRRDGFRCRWCGIGADEAGVVLELDHIVAFSLGGTEDDDNLATACERCNHGKAASGLRPSEVDLLLRSIGKELFDAGLPLGAVNRITSAAAALGLPPHDVALGWAERYREDKPSDPQGLSDIVSDLAAMIRPRAT